MSGHGGWCRPAEEDLLYYETIPLCDPVRKRAPWWRRVLYALRLRRRPAADPGLLDLPMITVTRGGVSNGDHD